jgi:thiosulfate/3-mercaptopyruvate sulfurtransferase
MEQVQMTVARSRYAHEEVLADTQWLAENLNNPNIRILEVDHDPENAYKQGHIPGAHLIWLKKDINDPARRDIINKEAFEQLLSRIGATPDTELVLYGDFNSWFAAFAFWVFQYYGHKKLKILDGGRRKWEVESRKYTKEEPQIRSSNYVAQSQDEGIRAYSPDVKRSLERKEETVLVDVRSPKEFSGEITAPPEYPTEHAQRGGHIPGAKNIPWAQAVNDDGTFKNVEELRALYEAKGVTPDKHVVAYCRIGERSSHTWFVLKYLLGYPSVRNYDGSWTEWGNSIGVPIER